MYLNLNNIIGSLICSIGMFISAVIILNKSIKNIKLYRCLFLIPISFIIIIYSTNIDNIIKIFCSLFTFSLIFKFILEEKINKCFIYSVVCYLSYIIGEISVIVLILLLNILFKVDLLFILSKSIIGNLIVGIISCITIYFFRNHINKYINKIDNNKTNIIIIEAVIGIFISISSINYLYIHNWAVKYEFVLTVIVIIGSFILIHSLLKEQLKNKEIIDKYSLLEEYLQTSAFLIEKYSSTVHKYNNNLIAVKGYYKKSISEGDNYVDNLLENYKTKKYSWFSKLNYISFDTIKYLIYYKLSKAEEKNLKIIVNVSKNIKEIDSNLLDMNINSIILEIIGEYFDNALYAASLSVEKELLLNCYLDNNKLIFEIANTFIDAVDINLIYKNGYTTKGKGHGLGLYEVNKSINENECIDGFINIEDNYFVAKLLLNLDIIKR